LSDPADEEFSTRLTLFALATAGGGVFGGGGVNESASISSRSFGR
jgi:hypothetical protein